MQSSRLWDLRPCMLAASLTQPLENTDIIQGISAEVPSSLPFYNGAVSPLAIHKSHRTHFIPPSPETTQRALTFH